MKRYSSFIILLFLSFSLFAQEKPKVVATASIFADMAEVLAGELVAVESIVPIGGDPHIHEPTPRDARLVTEADLILKNGLTFEGWLNELIDNSGTEAEVVLITEGIETVSSLTYENASDPHAWMNAQNGIIYAQNITEALIRLLPEQEDVFRFNLQVYRQQLEDLDQIIHEKINSIPEAKRILITSHDAFQYYGRRYGLQLEAILGTSTDAEAQTSDIVRINRIIEESQVPAVFIESTVNPKLLKQIAADKEISIGGKLYADSIGDEDSPASTYYDMLLYNTNTIVKALTTLSSDPAQTNTGERESGIIINYLLYGILALLLFGGIFFVIRKLN